jgi:hypothetical protein
LIEQADRIGYIGHIKWRDGMPVQELVRPTDVPPCAVAFLDDLIIQIVDERSGIKETELTMDIMVDMDSRDLVFDPTTVGISPEVIFIEIHRMIREGRIIGVDCEIGDGGYTFLVPARTKLRIAMPIHDRTRH